MKIFQSIFQSGKAGKHIWRPLNLKGVEFLKSSKNGKFKIFYKKMGACEGIEREWVKIKRGSSEKREFPQILMS